jgi:hypothetical protein
MLLAEVLVGDTTALRNRVLFSFVPATPFLVSSPYFAHGCSLTDIVLD